MEIEQESGIIIVDKPLNISSARVVSVCKSIWPKHKIGHGGTLDPLATGVLPIFIGKATKLSSYFLGGSKTYIAACKLGVTTDTLDREGAIRESMPVTAQHYAKLVSTLHNFRGTIEQIPPLYSALKYKGKPWYWWVRKGKAQEIQPQSRVVQIYDLEIKSVSDDLVWLNIRCGSGAYIRSLVYDIGQALGCGACLWDLRRTHVAHFLPQQMVNLNDLQKHHLLRVESVFSRYKPLHLSNEEAWQLLHTGKFYAEGVHRLYFRGSFIGIFQGSAGKVIIKYLETCPDL